MSKLSKKAVFILGLISGLVIGCGLVYSLSRKENANQATVTRITPADHNYNYINPLLAYDVIEQASPQIEDLKNKINNFIADQRKAGKVDKVSVYLRIDSNWIGIGEDEKYKPGSLFKVPIMIAYLKQAESDPALLQKKIQFNNPNHQSVEQLIPPTRRAEFGKEYTIEELINLMIVHSDNSAANILAEGIYLNQKNSYTEILGDLGLPAATEEISAKKFALFLRILRNATYLNREMSEKALGILAQTDFKDGLAAGLPNDVMVASKFGEVGIPKDGQLVEQLHDCGIIYYPNHPYSLCIMTQGAEVPDLQQTIAHISQLVYQEANNLYH